MWAEVNGERKKVACGPCIRGHRSSKCDHRDRVLVEVRKPGRPLSSCPHPSGSCSCERVVINYTIPKSSECACPSERAQPAPAVTGNGRIQKNRRRSTAINMAALEKGIRASQDTETDTSSITHTRTERSDSNDVSPTSSASSTPRLLPAQNDEIGSCCTPQPIPAPVRQGSCCSSKVNQIPEPVRTKSCCITSDTPTNTILNTQPNIYQHFGQQFQFQVQPQMPPPPQYQSFHAHIPPGPSLLPYSLGAPIYNHAAAAYQQTPISMRPAVNGRMPSQVVGHQVSQHTPKHNCHCGDSCACFGCAAHPNNATMMEYVRFMTEFQSTGGVGTMSPPLYDMPTYPHHPGFGAEAGQSMNFQSISQGLATSTPTQMNFQSGLHVPIISGTHINSSAPWQQPSVLVPTVPKPQLFEPSSYAMQDSVEGHLTLKMEDTIGSPVADSPSDGNEEETPTLSPTTFFWNQMTFPGCNDATGTCQCGDGCACVGCLTHGGHNGVPLDPARIGENVSFPDFPTTVPLSLDDPTSFMTFHPV